MHMR